MTADAELHAPSNPNPARMARELQDVLIARGIKVEDPSFRFHASLAIELVLMGYVDGLQHMLGQLRTEIAWDSGHEKQAVTMPMAGVEPMVRAAAFHAYANRNSLESAVASAAWPADMFPNPPRPRPPTHAVSAAPTEPVEPGR